MREDIWITPEQMASNIMASHKDKGVVRTETIPRFGGHYVAGVNVFGIPLTMSRIYDGTEHIKVRKGMCLQREQKK